jgi:hypothetical protein
MLKMLPLIFNTEQDELITCNNNLTLDFEPDILKITTMWVNTLIATNYSKHRRLTTTFNDLKKLTSSQRLSQVKKDQLQCMLATTNGMLVIEDASIKVTFS